MVATRYQAAGGAGQKGIDELAVQVPVARTRTSTRSSTTATRARRKVESSVHADTLAFNVVPMLGTLGDEGYTDEELKLQNESRKILDIPASRSRRRACACRSWSATRSPCRATFERELDLEARDRGARGVPEPRRPGRADAARVGRPRRGRRRPRAPRPRRPRARAQPLRRRRQPAQGRRAEHRADRRGAARARARARPPPAPGPPRRGRATRVGCVRPRSTTSSQLDQRSPSPCRARVERGARRRGRARRGAWPARTAARPR